MTRDRDGRHTGEAERVRQDTLHDDGDYITLNVNPCRTLPSIDVRLDTGEAKETEALNEARFSMNRVMRVGVRCTTATDVHFFHAREEFSPSPRAQGVVGRFHPARQKFCFLRCVSPFVHRLDLRRSMMVMASLKM